MAPFSMVPLGFPFSSLTTTAALSSNFILMPFALLYSFFCLTITAKTVCFLISGFPLTTEASIRSPTPAFPILPFTVLHVFEPYSFMMLAPELSQVGIHAPKLSPLVIRAFTDSILLLLFLHFFPYLLLRSLYGFHSLREAFLLAYLFNYDKILCLAYRPCLDYPDYISFLCLYLIWIVRLYPATFFHISLVFLDLDLSFPFNSCRFLHLCRYDCAYEIPSMQPYIPAERRFLI